MKTIEHQMWGIHGGRTGGADSLFLQKNLIALGWHTIGDLSKLPATREAFKNRVAEVFTTTMKQGALPVTAGQLYRFVNEAKIGDIVIYPSKNDRHIHIGRIESNYEYSPKEEVSYPHHRKVRWLKNLPRTDFTQGALYEIGAAMSFFAVKTYADEFSAAIEGKEIVIPVAQDKTVALVASAIEDQTRDYILKKLAQELKGGSFEDFIAHLLQVMGYKTQQPKRGKGADGGVDIIAHKDELGFEPPIIKVQVKSKEGPSGDPEVTALYGKCNPDEKALFVTLGEFSSQAQTFARNKTNLRLIAGDELVGLIFLHYEKFDSRYKGLLPLKRVYVPDPEQAED
ncbi:MAG: restriction endonuclease [Syntrophobacteraceae bacterium]|jgi:restriction system protein